MLRHRGRRHASLRQRLGCGLLVGVEGAQQAHELAERLPVSRVLGAAQRRARKLALEPRAARRRSHEL